MALNLPTWILFGLVAVAVAMSLTIVSVLLRAPRRKVPDEFMAHPPRRPRMSAATCLASLRLLVVSIAGGVVAFHLRDVTSLRSASSLWSAPVDAPTRDKIDVLTFDFALTLTLGAVTAVIAAFALLVIVLNQPWAIAVQRFERSRGRKNSTLAADAGHCTVMKALRYGVPMVLVPWGRDQPGVAARAESLGVAEVVPRSDCTSESLASAISRVLSNPSYTESAHYASERLQAHDSVAQAQGCAYIESVLQY
ncbi:MAG TPA: nucleotide disphospho-sugar-binding domain-containing protein [Acetobacteraceae bacterium]|nr:nucleotide disphospho-sugar-binding domain-containing protein [Acetobacteraceae bacterium]